MNKFTRHVPGYARDLYLNEKREYVIPSEEFETLDELFTIPFVTRFKDGFDKNGFTFTQFARSESRLMAMANDNTAWYVIGHVQDPSILDSLPNFNDVKKTK